MFQTNIISHTSLLIAGTTYRNTMDFEYSLNDRLGHVSQKLHQQFRIPSDSFMLSSQNHGTSILMVDSIYEAKKMTLKHQFDSLITNKPSIALCIQTADCLPIFIFCPSCHLIAMIHAGWRGTHKQILKLVLQLCQQQFNCNLVDCMISFGPGIGECCYQVGHEFLSLFPKEHLKQGKNGSLFLNLLEFNRQQALKMGISYQHVFTDSFVCTACHLNRFYSFRKEGAITGRMISFICLLEP